MAEAPATRNEARTADSLTIEGQRFAIVPEWIIDGDVSDCAFRLYAVLLRYGQSSGQRMPSRATLARRLRKRSVDTVDRAMKELVALGAVVVERRRDGKQNLTNRYHVRTSGPGRTAAATRDSPRPGRTGAASGTPTDAATPDRTDAATPAETLRPDPEHVTQEHPPPTWAEVAARCQELRTSLGQPTARWSAHSVGLAMQRCQERGWPMELAERALLVVAADPVSRSPLRVAEAGPWWDQANPPPGPIAGGVPDLAELEARLDALDGERLVLQQRARAALTAEGVPLTRTTVLRKAVALMDAVK